MGYYTDEGDDGSDDENQTARTYEVHQRTFSRRFDEEYTEVIGEIEIPENAIAVQTITAENAPEIVDVSWLEPIE